MVASFSVFIRFGLGQGEVYNACGTVGSFVLHKDDTVTHLPQEIVELYGRRGNGPEGALNVSGRVLPIRGDVVA